MAAGDDEGTVSIEVHRSDRHRVTTDYMNTLARLHLPNPNRFIKGARDDVIGLGVEVDTENDVGVSTEGFNAVAVSGGASIPDAEGAVVGGRANVVGVR